MHGIRHTVVALVLAISLSVAMTIPGDPHASGQTPPADGLGKVSGDGQNAQLRAWFPLPLVVEVVVDGSPAAGEPVTFAVVSGPLPHTLEGGASVGPTVVVETDANGTASAMLRASDVAGVLSVNATWGSQAVQFRAYAVNVSAAISVEGDREVGVRLLFDASGSSGNITAYVFDFGDGSISRALVEPRTLHVYSRAGMYLVVVTVHDERGFEHSAHLDVRIAEGGSTAGPSPHVAWAIEAAVLLGLAAAFYAYGQKRMRHQVERIRAAEDKGSDDMFEMAVSHALAGEREMAITYFRKVLRDDPRNVSAHFYMGVVLMELRRFGAASAALRRTLELDPEFQAARDALQAITAAGRIAERGRGGVTP